MTALSPAAASGAPDLLGPVIGFRQWRLGDGVKRSMYADAEWVDGRAVARCGIDGPGDEPLPPCCDAPPGSDCRCGLYAWYRPVPRLASAGVADLVAGAVALWGAVELHATGMRAERGAVVALELPLMGRRKRRRVEALAATLGVEVVPAAGLDAAAARHGGRVPDVLKPVAEEVEHPALRGGAVAALARRAGERRDP